MCLCVNVKNAATILLLIVCVQCALRCDLFSHCFCKRASAFQETSLFCTHTLRSIFFVVIIMFFRRIISFYFSDIVLAGWLNSCGCAMYRFMCGHTPSNTMKFLPLLFCCVSLSPVSCLMSVSFCCFTFSGHRNHFT